MHHIVEVDLGGRKITLETGKMAKQAGGAVVVRSGDAVVLVTACMADQPKVGAGFFPLTVDYREYTYSAGKIPGGFIKREGRPSEKGPLGRRADAVAPVIIVGEAAAGPAQHGDEPLEIVHGLLAMAVNIGDFRVLAHPETAVDRKSTRLNSSH